jgi:dipeptidyl aminopeptidase/acylaminoacyl peptidase
MIKTSGTLCLLAGLLIAAPLNAEVRPVGATVTLDGIPPAAPGEAARLADYLQARPARSCGFSPQGALLIRTRFGDSEQLHLVEQEGGARRQLTFGHDPVAWAAYSPDPARKAFAFLKDLQGDGRHQLYYQHTGEAAARMLSDGHSQAAAPLWSSSGREIAYSSDARDGQSHDIVLVDPESGAPPHLIVTGDAFDWRALDFAADDHLLLALQTVSHAESHLFVIDLASGLRRELDPSPTPVSIRDARLARDGQGVYYISNGYGEFDQLRYINLFSGQKSALSEHIAADIDALALSRDGRLLAFTSNEAGNSRLSLVDVIAHQDLVPPNLPFAGVMQGLAIDADGKHVGFSLAAPNHPDDVYVLDVAANHLAAWTHSEPGPIDTAKFVLPRLVNVPTFDHDGARTREIPTYLYAPAGAGKHPVLLELGGGPEEQFRPAFEPWIEYLVNEQGYTVVAPNLRGSPGLGKSYAAAGRGTLREDAIKDLGALLVWLRAQHDLDGQRVVISGRHYGAALAFATFATFPDRVRGVISVSGVSDYIEWLGSMSPERQAERRAEFGDERDLGLRSALRHLSPLANLDRINRPLLVVHGRNDGEVPLAQAEELVAVARSRSIPVWYLVANDQGGELRGTAAEEIYLRVFTQFLGSLP